MQLHHRSLLETTRPWQRIFHRTLPTIPVLLWSLGAAGFSVAHGIGGMTWEPMTHGIINRQYHAAAFIPGLGFAYPEMADTDGDGDLDLLVGGLDGHLRWYQNVGNPSNPLMSTPQTNWVPYVAVSLSAPDFYDLDGDGDLDLIVGDGDGHLVFIENVGNPKKTVWAQPVPLQAGLKTTLNARPELYDIDNNGLADLFLFDVVASGSESHQLRIFHYEDTDPGPGWNFVLKNNHFAGITVNHPANMALFEGAPVVPVPRITFADLSGDGLPDFFLGKIDGFFSYYRNNGPENAPTFTRVANSHNIHTTLGDATPCVGDLSGDGLLDVLAGGFDGAITFFLNAGTPQIPNHHIAKAFFNHDNGGPTAPMSLDLDADGDTDMVVGHHFGMLLHWFNTGGPMSPRWERKRAVHITGLVSWYANRSAFAATISLQHAKPCPVDYDGDGDIDYLVAERNGTLHLLENVGNPVVPIHVTAATNVFAHMVYTEEIRPVCGDLNGDGLVDVLIGREDGTLDLWLNTGTPTQGAWPAVLTNFAGVDVGGLAAPWIVDLDGDGDPDILIGAADGRLSVLENTGTATDPVWGTLHTDFGGIDVGERSVPCTMDWDGDGDLDIVCGEKQGGLLVFLQSTPKLHINPQSITRVGTDPLFFSIAESDGTSLLWDIPRNRSGATIGATNGVFVPGENTSGFYQYREYADVPIPDGNPLGYEGNIALSSFHVISELQVTVEITHADISQLKVVIQSPAGTEVTLYDKGETGANLYRVYADGGPYAPVQGALSDFNGEIATGRWLIHVIDDVPGVRGDLFNFGLRVNGGIPMVDTVRVRAADGREGHAYVNVVEASAASHAGKAIIVAGGRGLDDPVWAATRFMGEKAYNVLRLRGFLRENIRFLSLEPQRDVDGNGMAGDDAVPCTRAELEAAFGSFVQDAESLTLLLMDHGASGDEGSYFRLNAGEVVTPAELGAWIGLVQSNRAIDVVTSLDFCYSGTFLAPLAAASAARQVVMASCAPNELSYFIGGGQVSFTSLLLNNILQGQDLGQAFAQARDSMSPYQNALLDDNRDGLFTGSDGGRAASMTLGMKTSPGRNLPEIWLYTPNQVLTNTAPVYLYCSRAGSAQEILSAKAIITPPNHQPDPGSGNPVVDMPVLDLVWNPLTAYFEGYYDGFTQAGSYAVTFILEDIYGSVSYPKTSTLVQDGIRQRVLLVNGGSPADLSRQQTADFAYSVYRSRLYDASQIEFWDPRSFADPDADGNNDVDGQPSLAALEQLFQTELAQADTLVLHFIGASDQNTLVLGDGTPLPPAQLAAWLDLVAVSNSAMTVILDFAGSESYLPALAAPGRFLLASGQIDRPNVEDPALGFSSLFLGAILDGLDVSDAMTRTRKTLMRTSGNLRQRALLDDNGDGLPNQKNVDGQISRGHYIGSPFVTGEDRPFIGATMPSIPVTSTAPVLLWVDGVQDANGIAGVTVRVLPPHGLPNAPALALAHVPPTARYEIEWQDWSGPGRYTLIFEATDTTGKRSTPTLSSLWLGSADGEIGPDAYEPDNILREARIVSLPRSERHSLHLAGDEDWIRFHVPSNLVVDIETEHLGTGIDTILDLYRESSPGVLTHLSTTDEFGYGEGELTGLTFPEEGMYALRVRHDTAQAHSPGEYLLHVYVPAGPQGIWVVARNLLTLAPLAGQTVQLQDAGGAPLDTRQTDGNGQAVFEVAGGAYRLLSPPPSGFHPVYGYVSPGDTPDNPQSTYGNPRDLGTDDFGTLVFAGSSDPISVLGFYFFPVVTITGRVDLAEVEWPTQVRVQALDPATSTLYDRYPWTLYGEPWWLRADGRYPESLHLPAGIPLLLGFDGNGYGGPAVPLQDTEAGQILPSGLPPPTAYDSNTNNIPDAWEYFHFQRLVRAEDDEDGDGQSNREEYVGHTDPQDGTDRLLLPGVLQEDGFPVLRWFPRTQRIYTVEQRSLTDTQTVDVAQFEVGFPAPESLVWPVPLTETGGVYRLRVDLPAAP